MTPSVSIVIPSWNSRAFLHGCLNALGSCAGASVSVVDNASEDGSAEMVREAFPDCRLIVSDRNRGFAHACNRGIEQATAPWVLLLNADTRPACEELKALLRFAEARPDLGACSPLLVDADDRPQRFAYGQDPRPLYLLRRAFTRRLFRRDLHDWSPTTPLAVDWVSGACMLVRRKAIEDIGLLDERFFMYFEDNDWCLRLRRAGWTVWYVPTARVLHHGGGSASEHRPASPSYDTSLRAFYRKHYGPIARLFLSLALPLLRKARPH